MVATQEIGREEKNPRRARQVREESAPTQTEGAFFWDNSDLTFTEYRFPNERNSSYTKVAFFWDYSGIGILGVDGICVVLGAITFSE